MGNLRDHSPVVIDQFNGLWQRGDPDNTPLDHFSNCNNIHYIGTAGFETRYGISLSQNVSVPVKSVKRIYNYPTQSANTLLVLQVIGGVGYIYHVVNPTLTYGPILTISGMTDFAFQPFAGRAYISPFTTFAYGELNIEKGLSGEHVYVYMGDGTQARKAAGGPLFGTLTIANGAAGHTDPGFHIFGFVSEYDTGYLSPPGALTSFTTDASHSVSFGNVPTGQIFTFNSGTFIPAREFDEEYEEFNYQLSPPQYDYMNEDYTEEVLASNFTNSFTSTTGDPHVVARHLVATKVITNYDGVITDYQFFFVPNAIIPNNTDTFLNNISFFDADLLEDASYLLDNFTAIPAGAVMSTYHNRLVVAATYNDISLALVSTAGEPEAISQIDGLLVYPLDGNPITNAQELRDVFYLTKRSRTGAFTDNADVPSTWPFTVIDNALGTGVHGIATVLDSGSSNIDYLLIATYQGLSQFNGRYLTPELSWKIGDFWKNTINRLNFGKVQVLNAPIQKEIYIVLTDGTMLVANYGNGMDWKKIRWAPWSFAMPINTVGVHNIDEIIIGA